MDNRILKIIKQGESRGLEFKESLSLKNEIGETVSAFSNTCKGMILVGVKDSEKVRGVQIGKKTIEGLANYIKQNTDNNVYPDISVKKVDGEDIIIIKLNESDEKPVFFRGKAYKRVGKSNHKLSSSEIRKLAKESGKKVYWDEQVCEGAGLEDIDEEKVKWFLRKAKAERNFDIEPETPIREALERLGLMEKEKLTNAAVLLFGKKPRKFFLQAEVRCARFKGIKPVKPFIDMKVFSESIIEQIDKSLNFVLEHIPMKVYLAGKPEREERYEYPSDAIREAIINAVCHRDYETSTNIQIRIFDDRIEVWGCGILPRPLTPEDLKKKHKSVLRNPLIAKCFFLIKFVEQWGTGTNDMINMCLDWGLPEPEFEHITGDFVVTFRKDILTEKYLKSLELNNRQIKSIEYAKETGKITNKDYQKEFNVSERTASRELGFLVKKDIFIQVGITGKGTYYKLMAPQRRHKDANTKWKKEMIK